MRIKEDARVAVAAMHIHRGSMLAHAVAPRIHAHDEGGGQDRQGHRGNLP
jgi:hypothetical protein